MLVEINCSLFREKKIAFKSGLNAVIGDDNASNSIGKSTLLMVIDFVLGGNTFLKSNKDVIDELGHHEYLFQFSFEGKNIFFKRNTEFNEIVFLCDPNYQVLNQMSLEVYHSNLHDLYRLSCNSLSFRAMVGLYSRVWPKDNLEVKRPLHVVASQKATESIDNLIKTFDLFRGLKELSDKLKNINAEKSALTTAFNKKIISNINNTQFKKNTSLIHKAEVEISHIKANLSSYALDLKSLVTDEVLNAKIQKDRLLDIKFDLDSKLARVKTNLERNKFVNNKTFGDLINFFPNLNTEKLEKVEDFHSSLASILKQELKASELSLMHQLAEIDIELMNLETIISASLKSVENPNYIIDKVFELANSLSKAKTENSHFESKNALQNDAKTTALELKESKTAVLDDIMERINKKLLQLTSEVYGSKGKSPTLILESNKYEYTIFEDTGTGKAYSNLILFDLAVFHLTELPFLIHDSLLYKNVENNAVANLIRIYASYTKQSFIAIDEINKYGEAKATLLRNKAIHLTSNNVLYIRNWKTSS
ncbi:MAG: DUF2326 domain-containing protein [Methylophilus sp.]|nr:DUF2326 domain-containing protein [Methylophilus sp.]